MSLPYPHFTPEEMTRRRRAVEAAMAGHGVDHLVVYGADRSGSAVQWISGWPVTREGALLVAPGEDDVLFVQFTNHVPTAREMTTATDVRRGGPSTFASLVAELEHRGARRVGIIGPIGYRGYQQIAAALEVVPLDAEYVKLRLVKSAEEIEWLARGARLSDAAIEAVRDGAEPGMTEAAVAALCEGAYLAEGGTNHIHYFAMTSMEDPRRCVPSQWPSLRRLETGDVLTTEISASWWGYPGQVLRTMTVGADPSPLVAELHDVATAAFEAIVAALRPGATAEELVAAGSVIEDSGFTIYDDLVHGYGGGYWPPVLRTREETEGDVPAFTFAEGMVVVVQPNVITRDERLGVQTGELVLVTGEGTQRLHRVPPGLWRIG
jgi:Xaa-Pro aminopeptidase